MPAEDDALERAVADGVLTSEEANDIRARRGQVRVEAASDEPFRLVGNFADVFLCIGLLIVYWSADAFLRMAGLDPLLIYAGFAALFWVLAEFFVFGARRKFPAVISILLFVWMGYRAVSLWAGLSGVAPWRPAVLFDPGGFVAELSVLTGALVLALLRFRQPILVLALGLTGTLLVFALARQYLPETSARLVLMACGIAMLILGYLLDRRDPRRTGITHEWALWLFVLGSPLTVHPLFLGIIADRVAGAAPTTLEAVLETDFGGLVWLVGALALGFSLLGLLLDRRSLVASTLLYLSAVLTYAGLRGGLAATLTFAIVPLTVGLLVILLGVAWTPVRRALLAVVPFRSLFRPA